MTYLRCIEYYLEDGEQECQPVGSVHGFHVVYHPGLDVAVAYIDDKVTAEEVEELLSEATSPWWERLGLPPNATISEVERKRLDLLKQHHPDVGGSNEQAAEVNRAYADAVMALEGRRV